MIHTCIPSKMALEPIHYEIYASIGMLVVGIVPIMLFWYNITIYYQSILTDERGTCSADIIAED